MVGQRLEISVAVFNTRSVANSFLGQQVLGRDDNWTFYGVPVATWPECAGQNPFAWPYPIAVVVLNGNYSAQGIKSVANASFSIPCPVSPTIPTYTFEPSSDLVNITFLSAGGVVGHGTRGPYQLASSFTISGYWNLADLSKNQTPFCEPVMLDRCVVPLFTPFVPGVYTIGVADEWGQYSVLHFQVSGRG